VPDDGPLPWSVAWARSQAQFYAGALPRDHFRTSAHVGSALARALAVLVAEIDEALGSPPSLDVVDVGAGDGALLAGLLAASPPCVADRLRPLAVDVRPRPPGLDPRVGWVQGAAPDAVPSGVRGVLLAHELLDDVPVDVVEAGDDGVPQLVLVDAAGLESPGPSLADDAGWAAYGLSAGRARAWLSAWWPLLSPGDRAEIGVARDELWHALVSRLDAGTALAVDYGHRRDERLGSPGTLAAYREGALVAAVPDGSRNLTAHVAVDALAYRTGSAVVRQREALLALGVTGALPASSLASSDPAAYLDLLAAATHDAELLDPAGLGAFWWVRTDLV
jgi:SAM-dependent MidA family methyltransferase